MAGPRTSCGLIMSLLIVMMVALQLRPAACGGKVPTPPTWPNAFEMEYTLSLPYLSSLQLEGLNIPTRVWWDARANPASPLLRVRVYDGLDDVYVTPEATYSVFPRIHVRTCTAEGSTTGPVLGGWGATNTLDGDSPLPDLSHWTYGGSGSVPGRGSSHVWQLTERWWDKVNTYTFHTSARDGSPLSLTMMGVSVFGGSHYDHYSALFTYYAPLKAPLVLRPPKFCPQPQPPPDTPDSTSSLLTAAQAHARAVSLLPGYLARPTTAAAAAGSAGGLSPATSTLPGPIQDALATIRTWAARLAPTLRPQRQPANSQPASAEGTAGGALAYMEKWNREVAAGAAAEAATVTKGAVRDGFVLGATRWAATPDDVWRATAMGHMHGPSPIKRALAASPSPTAPRGTYLGVFQRRVRDQDLPLAVDWRGTGADGPVKDQAACGSCWAFATTGAMTGAWFLATGQSLSFSEQQVVDCAWDHGPMGCWGGWMESAMDYVVSAGGGRSSSQYPYLGANGFCRHNTTARAGGFLGWRQVTALDEGALMEAVATHGPLAIAFDAVHPTFKYYSGGVYYRSDCSTDEDSLNHAVVLVGYGTTPNGTDYWVLRNSWSTYWGDNGYFKLARKGNDCGITAAPVMVVVDEAAAAKALTPAGRAAIEAARARAITPRPQRPSTQAGAADAL